MQFPLSLDLLLFWLGFSFFVFDYTVMQVKRLLKYKCLETFTFRKCLFIFSPHFFHTLEICVFLSRTVFQVLHIHTTSKLNSFQTTLGQSSSNSKRPCCGHIYKLPPSMLQNLLSVSIAARISRNLCVHLEVCLSGPR